MAAQFLPEQVRNECTHQPGLAHTGGATHGDQQHLAARGTLKYAAQVLPLALPSDQYRAGDPGAHTSTIPQWLLAGQCGRCGALRSSPYVRGVCAAARVSGKARVPGRVRTPSDVLPAVMTGCWSRG